MVPPTATSASASISPCCASISAACTTRNSRFQLRLRDAGLGLGSLALGPETLPPFFLVKRALATRRSLLSRTLCTRITIAGFWRRGIRGRKGQKGHQRCDGRGITFHASSGTAMREISDTHNCYYR